MDFYDLLGVSRDADLHAIKRAYRRLARRLHPDLNPGDGVAALRFRAVVEAYETLSDPGRRRDYDAGAGPFPSGTASVSFGFEGFDFSGQAAHGAQASTFGDLFADVIHQTLGGGTGPEDGPDLHVTVTVSFADMMRGVDRAVSLVRRRVCRACRGAGAVSVSEATCAACAGTGVIRSARGRMLFSKPCAKCSGTGRQRRMPCAPCGGQGVDARAETVSIGIPAGVRDGERLRLTGVGHAGLRGGRDGDLYVTVSVEPHPLFRRDGLDLLLPVPVAVHEAALGTRFDIPTFDGPVRLRVPPGTQAGQRFRLRERGVPSPADGRRGDLVVEVRLVLPTVLDERSKALLKAFGDQQTEDVREAWWRRAE